jgi:hypothetical protein
VERECEAFCLCETWEVFVFLCCCISMLVCRTELHILHCCISSYKFTLLHWFVGENYTCYVVAFELLVATFLSFWLLHCYILTFNLLGFLFFSIDLLFFPWGCLWTLYVKFNCSRFYKSFGSRQLFDSSFIFWFCACFYFWPCN